MNSCQSCQFLWAGSAASPTQWVDPPCALTGLQQGMCPVLCSQPSGNHGEEGEAWRDPDIAV